MIKTDLDTFLKFIDQIGKQKHFWTVEIDGLGCRRCGWHRQILSPHYDRTTTSRAWWTAARRWG